MTRPPSILPTTAGLPRRNPASVLSADPRSASPNEGSVSPGSDPPPTVASVATTSTRS